MLIVSKYFYASFMFSFIFVLGLNSCKPNPIKGEIPLLQFNFDNDLRTTHVNELLSHESIELSANKGKSSSNAVKVSYVGYEKGSKLVFKQFRLSENLEEATLNYSVKFAEDFKFTKSGKLFGLVPKKKIVAGNKMRPYGWSARATFKKHGEIASYIYHQNKPKKYGDGMTSAEPVFTPGSYNDVAIYVKLNKPATSKNGVFEIWVDGKLIIQHEGIQYRSVEGPHTLINYFIFTTFHGGSSIGYAPKDKNGNFTTEYAWFDDIKIYKGKHINSLD